MPPDLTNEAGPIPLPHLKTNQPTEMKRYAIIYFTAPGLSDNSAKVAAKRFKTIYAAEVADGKARREMDNAYYGSTIVTCTPKEKDSSILDTYLGALI